MWTLELLFVVAWTMCLQTPLAVHAAGADNLGILVYFDAEQCPGGWEEFTPAQGRLVVSVTDSTDAGVTVGVPLKDREDRAHMHPYSTTATLPEKDVAAIGCCNDQGAKHDAYPINSNTTASSSRLPFAQFVLCRLQQSAAKVLSANDIVVPFGTVAFFDPDLTACPSGWQPFLESAGRALVPAYKEGGVVSSSSPPLKSGEDRMHTHDYSVSFTTTDVSYAGVEGCCNKGPAKSGTVDVSGTTASTSLGLPYIQLLTCQSTTPTFNSSFPSTALLWNSVRCAPGYNISFSTAGRFMVTLPAGGLAGATFGGDSLPPGGSGNPTHTHIVKGSVTTQTAGVGLASGCCGSGYAGKGTYSFDGASHPAADDFPYLMTPLCSKQSNSVLRRWFPPRDTH